MVDYQFLGMVAVLFAVLMAYEAALRRYRRRQDHGPAGASPDPAAPTDAELTRWVSVMDRVLRPHD